MRGLFTRLFGALRKRGLLGTVRLAMRYYAPGRPTLVRTTLGGDTFFLVAQDRIARELMSGEAWEDWLPAIYRALLPPTANALDLGANFGLHAVGMARHLTEGRVFAFEPLSLTFSQLQANVVANGLSNVTAYKFAVSDTTGDYLEMDRIYYGRETVNVGNTGVGRGGDGTLSVRIDDLPLPKIHFVKMDIQGSEHRAILGMTELIRRDRPILFVEIEEHHLRRMGSSSVEVIELLFSLGYGLLRIRTDYPCDHVAIPMERMEELRGVVEGAAAHPLDYLAGTSVELTFDTPWTYSSFEIRE